MFIPSGVAAAASGLLTITADKSQVSGGNSGASACGDPGSTDAVTVTPENGVPPYTMAWGLQGAPATNGPYTPTALDVLIQAWGDPSVCAADVQKSETWRATVTDALGNTAFVDVTVLLTWTDTS